MSEDRLIVHIDGYLITDLPLKWGSMDEVTEQMVKWVESRKWYLGASFVPVDEDGNRIELTGESKYQLKGPCL